MMMRVVNVWAIGKVLPSAHPTASGLPYRLKATELTTLLKGSIIVALGSKAEAGLAEGLAR